jgi:hypothetical protein
MKINNLKNFLQKLNRVECVKQGRNRDNGVLGYDTSLFLSFGMTSHMHMCSSSFSYVMVYSIFFYVSSLYGH